MGGEKKRELYPSLIQNLHCLINRHKAGSPTDPNVYWLHLKPREIAALYEAEFSERVSNGFVKKELRILGYGYRKISKNLAIGTYAGRDAQFVIC